MDDRCINGLDSLPPSARGCVLTIGNFDGVHVGHRRIVATARRLADADGVAVVAMTFEPPPDLVLRPDDAPQRLTPPAVKGRLLREAGSDWVVTVQATPALLSLSPEEFVDRIILRCFAPRHVVEGGNFHFGRRRAGDVAMLARAGERAGFGVHVADPVRLAMADGEQVVSSTLTRGLVAAGRVEDAARCLAREFTLYGRVVPGAGLGRTLDHHTANLSPGEQICPGDGVYAGRAHVAGLSFAAAISVGSKPTFARAAAAGRVVEAYLLDTEGDYYDRPMELSFVRRLRDQQRYDGPEALREQMVRDVAAVRRIIGQAG
ncbi:MAG TPA: bifunctional riboflavin kinase/FMN adenylyltransferase [Phycisphaerae bacterium]|nr:bifunctional riboflavin kinase/FMN adenylyltransferase [Phycisphaerae bacterium]